jgi:hypothetical protein
VTTATENVPPPQVEDEEPPPRPKHRHEDGRHDDFGDQTFLRRGWRVAMPDGQGYEVLTDELGAHAGQVDGLAQRLRTAVQQVTMDDSAYGVICQPFALLLDPFERLRVRALQSAQESVEDTAGKVQDAVQTYGCRPPARRSRPSASH